MHTSLDADLPSRLVSNVAFCVLAIGHARRSEYAPNHTAMLLVDGLRACPRCQFSGTARESKTYRSSNPFRSRFVSDV